MTASDSPLDELRAAYERFAALVEDIRPELHRFCARMTGSVIEGEDVVQDALARAFFELSQLRELPALRTWLFRIAHHRAIDHLRHRARRAGDRPLDEGPEMPTDLEGADASLERAEALDLAVARFLALAPAQRGGVILKDVLDYSLDEIAAMLEMTVPAVKAALHRGRVRLRQLADEPPTAPPRPATPTVERYAALFNARDWEGVRAMLVDEVKLDLVSREKRSGIGPVGGYLTNYSRVRDWHLSPVWLEGREVLAVHRDPADPAPSYWIELTVSADRVVAIRDYRHVPYIGRDARFE